MPRACGNCKRRFKSRCGREQNPPPSFSNRTLLKKKGVKTEEKEIRSERQKEEKEILLHREEKAKKRAESARRHPNLLVSTSKGSNLQGEETEDASVIGGGQWTGGEVNSSAASLSTSPSTSIPSSNSVTLQISSGLYWVPFYFEGGQIPTTSSGALDVNQVKSWIESGNFDSGAYIGLGGAGGGGISIGTEYNTGTIYGSPLFGGVDPKTGDLLSGGITTNRSFSTPSGGAQTFEAFALSQCESNSPVSGGVKTDALLGALSTSPSSCLEAFQKNAEAMAKINGTSYDLLSYSGISSLLSVLDYSIPSNSATGYQGPGYLGPVTVAVGLSPALMYLLANYFGQSLGAGSSPENFSYQVDVYRPDSSQTGYVKGNGIEWIFNPSLYQANFKAVAEDGEPLKEVYITITANTSDNGLYIAPGYWDSEDLSNSALSNYYNNLEPLANPSSYKYFGWVNFGWEINAYGPIPNLSPGFVLDSISGEPGEFSLPKLPSGTYSISASWSNDGLMIDCGTIGGSSYEDSGFNITLGSNGETISPQGDSDGFIDPSTRTVVMEAHNPFAEVLNSEGEAEESPDISLQYGKEHTFSYQLQTYLPYSAPFSLSFDPGASYNIELADAKVAGIAISTLKSHGLVLSGDKVTLNASAISYVEQNGYMPASYSSPGGVTKLSSQGKGARIFSITIPTYLSPSFKAGNAVSYAISYSNSVSGQSGQTITGSLDDEDANNGWFKAEGEDGEPLSELTLEYQESSPSNVQGSIKTLTLSSSPTDPGLFVFPPGLLPCQYSVNVRIPEANYYNTYDELGSNGAYAELFVLSPQQYAGGIGFGDNGFLSPPFVDASSRTVVANVQSPSSQILTPSDKVDASSYPTETVGKSVPFTYQAQIFFSAFPATSFTYAYPPSYTQQILIGEPSGVTVFENPSDIDVAGIPFSTLEAKGASVSFDEANGDCPDDAQGSCPAAILISLPSSLMSYIASHGFKPATVSEAAGTVPFAKSFGQLSVTFRAYLDASNGIAGSPSVWEGYEYQSDGPCVFYFDSFSSPQVYTNGPADDRAPSSLTVPSSPSSSTGLQFQSLWRGSGAPAKGAKFTVQNENEGSPYYGEYLNGDPSDFTGWSWSKSPQDFSQSTPRAIFSFGGLADGTYTVTEVDPATGAEPPSSLSFTGNLSYSSPENLKAVSDPMNLLSPAQKAVYFVVAPSRLPLTGGKGIPALSLAAVFLAALGAGVWVGLKRKGA